MGKRRPRAQVRKLRDRGRPGRTGARGATDYLAEEDHAAGERVLPRGARERSDQARSREELPPGTGELESGEVIAFRGLTADVLTAGRVVTCVVRGRLETADTDERTLFVVGDLVEFTPLPDGTGVIERMLPRQNVLLRAAPGTRQTAARRSRHPRFRQIIAANVERVLLVTSVRQPRFRPGIADRFMVAASSQELPAVLVVNKIDLAAEESVRSEMEAFAALYSSLGARVILTSATEGTGLEELGGVLREARTVLVGHSGVGKSSLLNAVAPDLELPVKPVNRKTGKGTHATSVARLLRLGPDVEVIDTPGVRALDIVDLGAADLEAHFPEFLPLLDGCEKDNCTHRDEPGCEVKRAVEDGRVHPRRYESYLSILAELDRAERPYAG